MVTVEEWYQTLPPFTRYWFTSATITAITLSIGIPLVKYLYLDWNLVASGQIWRLITCFTIFSELSFNWVMAMYLMCQHVRELEMTVYSGRRGAAEFVFVAMYGMLAILLLSFLGFNVNPSVCLLSMFTYLWSRVLPHAPINVYGFTFARWHMPAIIVGLSILTSRGPPFDPIFGVVVGHIWKMLTEILPRVYNKTLIVCPEALYQFIDRVWPRLPGDAVPVAGAAGAAPGAAARPAWQTGAGYRLGD